MSDHTKHSITASVSIVIHWQRLFLPGTKILQVLTRILPVSLYAIFPQVMAVSRPNEVGG
ncbi:hypothetical protein K5009_005148 [Escherichia coli]|nr:hypothetical protein [Escherichia coli]EGF1625253.1 hypothetical protein [Escherichia coli]EIK8056118.1 hypothetical protein [Escherichia coli]